MSDIEFKRSKFAKPPDKTEHVHDPTTQTSIVSWKLRQPVRRLTNLRSRSKERNDVRLEQDVEGEHRNTITLVAAIAVILVAIVLVIRSWSGQTGSNVIVAPGPNRGSYPVPPPQP